MKTELQVERLCTCSVLGTGKINVSYQACTSQHNGCPNEGTLKPLDIIAPWCSKGFHDAERRLPLGVGPTHREIFSKYLIKPKSNCIYHFPIDLEQKRTRPSGSKSIGKWKTQSDFVLISVCRCSKILSWP